MSQGNATAKRACKGKSVDVESCVGVDYEDCGHVRRLKYPSVDRNPWYIEGAIRPMRGLPRPAVLSFQSTAA